MKTLIFGISMFLVSATTAHATTLWKAVSPSSKLFEKEYTAQASQGVFCKVVVPKGRKSVILSATNLIWWGNEIRCTYTIQELGGRPVKGARCELTNIKTRRKEHISSGKVYDVFDWHCKQGVYDLPEEVRALFRGYYDAK